MKRNLKIAIKRAQTELARRMPSVSDLRKKWLYLIFLAISANALADMGGAAFLHIPWNEIPAPAEPDTIRPRFSVKRTAPRDEDDLKKRSLDLKDPDNLKTDTVYDPATGNYTIGTKVGDSYLNAPLLMSPEEYQEWSLQKSLQNYYRQKNSEAFENEGKNKFDFTDMQFDLGPAEKIFGPGGVRIKTQGSAELKIGGNLKKTDNPSLSENRRKTFGFDFEEKINMSMNGSVGDKINMNLNYNTDATFDFDAQSMKLRYEGKEDEIIKLIEGGNVSLPTNSSLIKGASSLFGLRADLQFGKLKLQTVVSQKKSASKSVSSKGGTQTHNYEFSATEYEENRHFFLAHFFREHYDQNMSKLPTVMSGVTIKRIELWVTNKSGSYESNRNIVAFTDLGEHDHISNPIWSKGSVQVAANAANTLYSTMTTQHAAARDISQTSSDLDAIAGFEGSVDYEKLQSARLLSSSEYTVNNSLGYVSLNFTLQPDEVLAVAFEYTYNGTTYQVGEFSADLTDNTQALFVKALKNTSNTPQMGNWDLMMKNVYSLGATTTQKDKFKLYIQYQSDSAGVYVSYIPEAKYKNTKLLRVMNLDRLDANNRPNPNGQFDYVEGYTINKGRIYFPVTEPFGSHLRQYLNDEVLAEKYCFDALYDSTKTMAKQIAEKNKFLLSGEYKGNNGAEISLGAMNVPQGSVTVTAGGVTLTENTDYTVDYSMGVVTIINQSIIDAGTNVSVDFESNDNYGMQRKTLVGFNLQYDVSKDFTFGGTFMFLNEQPLTTKVNMGEEPLKNTLWGVNLSWKKESQWLTNLIDKIPLIDVTEPSQISFTGEFAQLIAGQNKKIQGSASYIDDFENTKNGISVMQPTNWMISSVPSDFEESKLVNDVRGGYNRALLSWYTVDPLFTRQSSSLTPAHIKSDLNQLSNHYVREVYERELYPNKTQTSYNSAASLPVMNLAFYPTERGAYNLDPNLDYNGRLTNPKTRWGGMMRKLDTNDFETANIEYVEFWLLDPFIYTRDKGGDYGGDFYLNLGEVSEDILHDGKKFFESGMPIDGNSNYYTETAWGRVPNTTSVVYAFNNESGARERQDIGLNGLNSEEERTFGAYREFLMAVQGKVSPQVYDSLMNDPAGDDYHYFRGSDYDAQQRSILDRYKYINLPEGNSRSNENANESYDTSYKTTPDVEDINQDYTLNEYEKYYQYKISIRPEDFIVGQNHIVDKRTASVKLRNGNTEEVNWYQFRIPLTEYQKKVGNINDFTSIRFMRMFLTGFEQPVILRFATLDLVKAEWRSYEQALYAGEMPTTNGSMEISAVNIEENNDKTPVNYVLPPGISRVVDPAQSQLAEDNEQALSLTVRNLATGDARAVYKNTNLDMRQYKHLQMFVHANALAENVTETEDNQTSIFIRLGSDYKNNFYEYEIPLKLTAAGRYDTYSAEQCRAVWPEENMLDIDLSVFTKVKQARNREKSLGNTNLTTLFSVYDDNRPNNKVSVMGNPTLGEVKTIMIGVRNNARATKSVEVWANELRLQEYSNDGGWAAQGTLNIQFSDLGSVNLTGHMETAGFGGIEDKVSERNQEDMYNYSITTSFELGKLLPEKVRFTAPIYYSFNKEVIKPKYNPLDTDMLLEDALDACTTEHEKDSLRSLTTTETTNKNFSLSNVKFNIATPKHPMPYDPANFSFSYSHSESNKTGETTAWETEKNWNGAFNYNYSPEYKPFEPFKKMIKSKSKWWDIIRDQNFNYLPQNISFNTNILRNYYEYQERDIENLEDPTSLPLSFSKEFLWNRDFSLKWDLTKNLHFSFNSATHAEIEEPNVPVNKDLYADQYQVWKDSVWHSIKGFGTPLDYQQDFTASYKVPLEKIPCFSWISLDGNYTANYSWERGMELEDGTSYGNTINNQRSATINGRFNLETLYNFSSFLKEVNKKFSASERKKAKDKSNREREKAKAQKEKEKEAAANGKDGQNKDGKDKTDGKTADNAKGTANAKVKNPKFKGFAGEITLKPDTTVELAHNQKSRRIRVTAVTAAGRRYPIKFKKLDKNKIRILNMDSVKLRVNVIAKTPAKEKPWYPYLQGATRFLMMVRNVSVSYRNTFAMSLPGFLPNVGDMLGQRTGGGMQPGLDFAFGLTGESYIDKANERGWLLNNDSISTPATTNAMEDLQLKATLEPIPDLKIDLNASRTVNSNKSIQYMYAGMPTTQSGSFTMTTISIKSAFESRGDAGNGYSSKTFARFQQYLNTFQSRVEARYANATYPAATGLQGKFDPANGTVDKYSSDVMIPAFLAAYTGGGDINSPLDIFPSLARMLPNWTVSYKGLAYLPWIRDHFKSVTLNHSYKSIYSVGAYNTYSSWMEYMGDLGFIQNTTDNAIIPSSMYDISSVSINEAFSPLAGLDLTLNNNMTVKVEYRKTRVLTLSMTAAQLNEACSNDFVIGWGYKINDFKFSSLFGGRRKKAGRGNNNKQTNAANNRNNTRKSSTSAKNSRVISHDLNLRFDFSFRNQDAITRNIQTSLSEATSGNKAIKASFSADYTMSRYVTLSLYYDRQRNQPLLSSNAYPTITQDFGFSLRFSLTR